MHVVWIAGIVLSSLCLIAQGVLPVMKRQVTHLQQDILTQLSAARLAASFLELALTNTTAYERYLTDHGRVGGALRVRGHRARLLAGAAREQSTRSGAGATRLATVQLLARVPIDLVVCDTSGTTALPLFLFTNL